jgi:ribosomal protein L39E
MNTDPKGFVNTSNINYRLMQEWEVPEWIRIKTEDPNKL